MADIKLKLCPFCGKEEPTVRLSDFQAAIVCSAIHGGCGASTGYWDTTEEAIRAWNRRVENETD